MLQLFSAKITDYQYSIDWWNTTDYANLFDHASLFINSGEIIPKVNYIESELKTWETVYNKMKTLHEKGACSQYMKVFAELETRGLYSANKIPQLEDVSRYLRGRIHHTNIK